MTKIFKAMSFGSARGERQNRVKSVERLDSTLLIDTEDRSVYRRLKVQANDVGRLLFKLRIIAGHVTTQPMRLNTEMAPDTAHARLANAQLSGQPIAAPVGRTVSGTLTRGLQDTRLSLSGPRSALTPVITRIKSRQTLLLKALLPLPDILVTAIQSPDWVQAVSGAVLTRKARVKGRSCDQIENRFIEELLSFNLRQPGRF